MRASDNMPSGRRPRRSDDGAKLGLTALVVAAVVATLLPATPGAGARAQSIAPGQQATEAAEPDPGAARGYERPPGHAAERSALLLPRVILLPLRIGLHVVTVPVRTVAGMMSSSGLPERAARGLRADKYFIPVAGLDPSLGANAGFRAGHISPFHDRGCVTYRAAWGGTKEQVYALTMRSREMRAKGWTYRLTAKWEVIPDHNYFGIGNSTPYAARTYYTEEKYLFLGTLGYAPSRSLRFDLTLSHHRSLISRAAYIEPPEKSIEERFPTERQAPGLHLDPQSYWVELAATLDRRNAVGRPTRGWLAEIYAGHARGAGLDGTDYNRYGAELSGYIPLGAGRVLALRVTGEEARTNSVEPIKLTELISLGGRSTLRGYVEDRFIDNAAVTGTAEYRYQIAPFAEACLFADFGKVMPRLLDFDTDNIHRSWGGGLRIATNDQFLFRVQAAWSDETYVILGTLESFFEREDRRERR